MKSVTKILKVIILKIKEYFFLFLMLVSFFVFVSFAEKSIKTNSCNEIHVKILPEKSVRFISQSDVINLLTQLNDQDPSGLKFSEIKLFELEKLLVKDNFINNAEIYTDFKGNVYIDVFQKIPVIRLISVYGANHYLCSNGDVIPFSFRFTPKVIVANGYTENTAKYPDIEKNLLELALFIEQDEFLSALIGQIYVKSNRQVILIPKVENLIIEFGAIEDLEIKFKKLLVVYKKILPFSGWNIYDKIDLRFNKQIVLNKK